jgi:hypothetical protein
MQRIGSLTLSRLKLDDRLGDRIYYSKNNGVTRQDWLRVTGLAWVKARLPTFLY